MNMKKATILLSFAFAMYAMLSCKNNSAEPKKVEKDQTELTSTKAPIETIEDALKELKEGNVRFVDNKLVNTNYPEQIDQTKGGQKPHSVVLACMDSRVPPEIIFDQGIGNIFTIRVAGNIEDDNVLGSMEYAVEHAGSKLIVVMGHNHCGAVTGAVKDIKMGNLTQLVAQIKPAIKSDPNDPNTVDYAAQNNVEITIKDIVAKSEIIKEMLHEKKIAIIGAFYDIETGHVSFKEEHTSH